MLLSQSRGWRSHTLRISKMLLVGYPYGITSERRLAREVQVNLAYRWFLGYDLDEAVPDHSVFSKARARFSAEVFEEFFRWSIDLCRTAGLVTEGPVYLDSTLIRAGASVDSLIRRDDPIQPPLSVAEYLRRLNQEAAEEEEASPPSERGPTSGDTLAAPTKRPPNQTFQSRTDPEATLVDRLDFGRHLAYKAHVAVARKRGQVITAAIATTGVAADEHLLAEVLWQHRRLSGRGRVSLPRRPEATPSCQGARDAPGAIPCAQGQLWHLWVRRSMCAVRKRTIPAPVLRPGVCGDLAEDRLARPLGKRCMVGLRGRSLWTGQKAPRPETDAAQGEVACPNSAVGDGGGDEH